MDPRNLAELTRPADLALISENNMVDPYDGTNRLTSDAYWQSGKGGELAGGQWQVNGGPNSSARWDADIDGTQTDPWQWSQTTRYRHNGLANIAFADGHVKAVSKGQLSWCRNHLGRELKPRLVRRKHARTRMRVWANERRHTERQKKKPRGVRRFADKIPRDFAKRAKGRGVYTPRPFESLRVR